jgi:site-specific DNA-cytosine methylase
MNLKHAFICEKDEAKRGFLHGQFKPSFSFGDVADLGSNTAKDLFSGINVFVVPWVHVLWAGFSCKSRTRCSSKSSQNLHCMQRQDLDAETSYTFEKIYAYIARVKPLLVILENVVGLLQKAPTDLMSDAEYVMSSLRKAGYMAKVFKFDCEHFGSRAARLRI